MSKGLELFQELRKSLKEELNVSSVANDKLDIIEKELKALEIIKEKNVDVAYLRWECNELEHYNEYCPFEIEEDEKLTQKEFGLLKEVLL